MKPVLLQAMKYPLQNIRTFKGYAGDYILKLTFKDKASLLAIREYVRGTGVEAVVKIDKQLELLCIYKLPDDIYNLK